MQFATFDDFRRQIGKPYEVEVQGGRIAMKLQAAQELPSMGRQGGSFRLEFIGPLQPLLPQAIYPFHGGGQRHEIFIVPIAQEQRGTRYEAIFV
ncbi:MAG TPA: hypothetical protein VLK25_12075 [Allosphingosinicella sp.]|nr:hypothetical protein [Allosphingosinicella sp.]